MELAAVTSLVSQGKTGATLKTHMTAMLHVGWTKKDIQELPVVEAMLTLETL